MAYSPPLFGVLPGQADWHSRIPDPEICRARVARLRGAERVTLDLLSYGYSLQETAAARAVAMKTVRNQLERTYRVLGVEGITQALAVLRRAEDETALVEVA